MYFQRKKNRINPRYLSVNVHLKLLISQRKFSGSRKFTLRYQQLELISNYWYLKINFLVPEIYFAIPAAWVHLKLLISQRKFSVRFQQLKFFSQTLMSQSKVSGSGKFTWRYQQLEFISNYWYLKVNFLVHLKLLVSPSKFSGTRKFTLRYQQLEFISNYWCLKVNFLVPENLLWDTSSLSSSQTTDISK